MHYVAANNGKIPDEGEYDFHLETSEGHDEMLTFQIAEVNKALGSVSYMVDRRYRLIFDQDDDGRDISVMIYKPENRITRLRRERNVWILDAAVEVDDGRFRRQG